MATGTEVAALAGKCQQELMLARITTHTRETVLENRAGLELLDHLAEDLAPLSPAAREALIAYRAELVEMIFDEASSYTVQKSSK